MRGTSSSTGSITWSLPPVATCSATPSGKCLRSLLPWLRSYAVRMRRHTYINKPHALAELACPLRLSVPAGHTLMAISAPFRVTFCFRMHAYLHIPAGPLMTKQHACECMRVAHAWTMTLGPPSSSGCRKTQKMSYRKQSGSSTLATCPRHHPPHPAGMSGTDYVPPAGCSAVGPHARKTAAFSMAPPTGSAKASSLGMGGLHSARDRPHRTPPAGAHGSRELRHTGGERRAP